MDLLEFIAHINRYIPTDEQIREKRSARNITISDLDVRRIRMAFELRYEPIAKVKGKLDALILDTNIREVGIGMVQFYEEILIEDSVYRCFADYNYDYEFAERLLDSKIVIVERGAYDMGDVDIIANNIDEFLQLLIIITNSDRHQIYDIPMEGNTEIILNRMIKEGVSKKWLKLLLPTIVK